LSAEELKWEASKFISEGAVAITTSGWVKHTVGPEACWQRFTEDEDQGMWVLQADEDGPAIGGSLSDMGNDQGSEAGAYSTVGPLDLPGSLQPSPMPMPMQLSNSVMSHHSQRSGASGIKSEAMDSKGRWEQSTVEKLNRAKNLTKQAVKSIVENHAAHEQANKLNLHTQVVTQSFKKKNMRTEDLCKGLEDRIESVEDTIRQVGECLFQLQRSHRCKWAPLNVVERRLELRDGRPIQELVRDHCQEALERERTTLVDARSALTDQIQRIKDALLGLDKLNGELREDLQHKRHALRIDRSCLSPKKPASSPNVKDRLVLPVLQDIPYYSMPKNGDASVTGQQNEEARAEFTQRLVTRALRAEEEAMRLANESDAMMVSTRKDCAKATAQAQAELSRRVDEMSMLKRQLEAQMLETDETIAQMELSLSKTRQTLDSHDRPLRALDKQFSQRGQRTHRESNRDPVHEEMEGHLEHLKKSARALTGKFQATKEILDDLRSSKQQMQEDYRNKVQAGKIDDACIKVTPRKSMTLDRMDPRGGRCREPSSARKKPPRPVFSGAMSGGSGAMSGYDMGMSVTF